MLAFTLKQGMNGFEPFDISVDVLRLIAHLTPPAFVFIIHPLAFQDDVELPSFSCNNQ